MARTMLFSPWKQRDLEVKNRIVMSPMCMYRAKDDGKVTPWHQIHYATRAVGGVGVVMLEATAITPPGRISPHDLGLWSDDQIPALATLTRTLKELGAVPAVQLAHAGRKAGVNREGRPIDGWTRIAPSALPFSQNFPAPSAMSDEDLEATRKAWVAAAERALAAGFEVIELHMAHGYLMHQFLSPLSNQRTDAYGGRLENRMRFPLEVARAVRAVWPDSKPLWVRISATDWAEGGWDLPDSIAFARALKTIGVDLIDVSSGGTLPNVRPPVAPGYQVPFAARIRAEAQIATGAVGLITQPEQAETILQSGQADLIFLGRTLLRHPYWPIEAALSLGEPPEIPRPYLRAYPRG